MIEYKALIVDDDPWMQRILSKTLQNFGFKQIYLASNGFEGIGLAVDELPYLIILDILMPELSGHLTLKVLKHIRLTKNIPVLMVSAMSDTENLGKAIQSGSAGFISKPFTRSTVYEKLVQIFGKYNLDKIAKGEPIDFDPTAEDEFEDQETIAKENELLQTLKDSSSPYLKHRAEKESFDPDKIREQYKEEEEKSLEAIKKLLLKNK